MTSMNEKRPASSRASISATNRHDLGAFVPQSHHTGLLPTAPVVDRELMPAIMHFPNDPIMRRRFEIAILLLQARKANVERAAVAQLSESDYRLVEDIGWNEIVPLYKEAKTRVLMFTQN
jgi:hypothetical protein